MKDIQNAPWPFPSEADEIAFFENLRQQTPGVVARYLHKRISIPITRHLLSYPITPNQVTAFHAFLAFVGLYLTVQATYWSVLSGAVLVWFSAVLDGCDGEIARAKNQCTGYGKYLDSSIDYLKSVAYAVLISRVVSLQSGNSLYHHFSLIIIASCVYLVVLNVAMILSGRIRATVIFNMFESGFEDIATAVPVLGTLLSKIKFVAKNDFLAFAFVVAAVLNVNALLSVLMVLGVAVEVVISTYLAIRYLRRV